MSDEERLKWLKEIEKDIFVCSLESTFVQDLKSCAIHSAIETLENQKTGHWIKQGKLGRTYRCECCGNTLDFEGVNAGRGSANFCPNCNAKMQMEGE